MTKREAKREVCRVMAAVVWHHREHAEWVQESAGGRDEDVERLREALGELHDELMARGDKAP